MEGSLELAGNVVSIGETMVTQDHEEIEYVHKKLEMNNSLYTLCQVS